MENSNNSKAGVVLVTLIVAGLVGGGAGYAIGMNKDDDSSKSDSSMAAKTEPNTATKAADLRVVLNTIEKEHVALANATTRAGFDGSPMFDAAGKATFANSKELSDAVASVYGPEAGAKFNEIFDSHIKFFVDYTVASKKGDKAGMDKAVQDLNGYVEAIAAFLSGANPNLPKDVVAQVFTEHVGLLKASLDTHVAADYAGSYAKQKEAITQIGKIADSLAGAIVKQSPDKFTANN